MKTKHKDLDGITKIAILIMALGEDIAGQTLEQFNEHERTLIARAISDLNYVPIDIINDVANEFLFMFENGPSSISGSKELVRAMLLKTMSPEEVEKIMAQMDSGEDGEEGGGLEIIQHLDVKTISSFLTTEHPQTCAIILAHLEYSHAAEVIKSLPEKFQAEVTYRIANLDKIAPDVIRELDVALAIEFSNVRSMDARALGGPETVASMLNGLSKNIQTHILEEIALVDKQLAEDIQKLMFTFEDILGIDDRSIQLILKEVDSNELLIALKNITEPLKEKIFANMSERAALMMKEDLEAMGPTKVPDVEAAQQKILATIKKLADEGRINLPGSGEQMV